MKEYTFLNGVHDRCEFIERRHNKDWVARSVNIIAVIGWTIAFASWMLINQAKPETEDFFTRLFNGMVRNYWDLALLRLSVVVLSVSFLSCIVGFSVNRSRHHRKTDRYNKSILILSVITFTALIVFIQMLL